MNIFIFITFLLVSCTGIPKGTKAVDNFEVNRYLGTWYEVARLDNRFEQGLDNVSATYLARTDGGIDVVNKGWNSIDKIWETAEGKAYFVDTPDQGRLKVSFFGPFYSSYNIIELDKDNYSYAMVTGAQKSYLWILSRTKQMDKSLLNNLIAKAKSYGFETDRLIWVEHNSE